MPPSKRKPPLVEMGVTGLQRSGGYVHEEFLPGLRGTKAIRVFAEMRDNDPVVGGVLFAVDKLIRQVEWRVQSASPKKKDEKAAQFVEECLRDMSHSWEDHIAEALSMLVFGWSWHEIVYKYRRGDEPRGGGASSKHDDGKVGWRKLPIRSQDTLAEWEFGSDGSVSAMVQIAPPDYKRITIPIERSLLYRTTSYKNNPEGRSILRNAYRPWYMKRRLEEIESIGTERDLAGFPILYVDPVIMGSNTTSAQAEAYGVYKDIVQNVRRDSQEGLILPSSRDEGGNLLYELKLLSSGSRRQFDTDTIIKRYDQRITLTALADFLLLGSQMHGSFAMSSDKTDTFAVALRAWLEVIRSTFNRYALPRLFKVNAMDSDSVPTLEYGDIESPDLGSLGNFVQTLAAAGVPLFPDDMLENHLRRVASLPERDSTQTPRDPNAAMPGMPGQPGQPMPGQAGKQAPMAPKPTDMSQLPQMGAFLQGAGAQATNTNQPAKANGAKKAAKKATSPAKKAMAKHAQHDQSSHGNWARGRGGGGGGSITLANEDSGFQFKGTPAEATFSGRKFKVGRDADNNRVTVTGPRGARYKLVDRGNPLSGSGAGPGHFVSFSSPGSQPPEWLEWDHEAQEVVFRGPSTPEGAALDVRVAPGE